MTRDGLELAKREDLIEFALSAHAAHQAAQRSAEQEKARRVEAERQLAWFKKQLFGAKSEKRSGPIAEVSQLSLGEAALGERRTVEQTVTVKAHARVIVEPVEPKGEPPLRFDDSVPRTRRVILPPEALGLDESAYERIDERVTQRLVQTPALYQVEEIVRPVVKLKAEGRIVTAPADPGVLERSLADVSVLAGLLIDKFRFHLPLTASINAWRRAGSTWRDRP